MAAERLPGRHYSIHDDTAQALADAVRYRTGSHASMTPVEMIAKLKAGYYENYDIVPYYGINAAAWSRPQGWPDLDSLDLEFEGDTSFVYMTYDADAEASAVAWHIETSGGAPATVEIGHIESGSFVADQSFSASHNTNFVEWLDNYEGFVVVRITGALTKLYSVAASGTNNTQAYRQQPVLERIAYVPTLTTMGGGSTSAWGLWTLQRDKVVNGDGAALTSIASMYVECNSLQSLDLSAFYTPNVTTMASAFSGCIHLGELDLRHWDVANVTTMANMFQTCYGLRTLDLRTWDTGKVTTFASMFADCRSLKEIKGIAGFDTGAATTFASMFSDCRSIKELPIGTWDTGNVTTLESMFNKCNSLDNLDLHLWNVGKVTKLSSTFAACYNLKWLKLTGWETGTLTTVGSLFTDCRSLQEIDVSWLVITSACTNIYYLFAGCWSLKKLAIPSTWNVSGISNSNNCGHSVFLNCYSLEEITGIKDWNFQHTNSLTAMFSGCRSLKTVDVSGWNVDKATNLSNMFLNCYSLKELDLSDWDVKNCTTLAGMFQGCWSLKSVGDISEWDTAKVTTLASMFSECYSLQSISDLSDWDVARVTTTASMFSTCASLKEITIKNWTLSLCTTIATMFRYCYSLEKITFTGWSLPKLTSTAPAQFLGDCYSLKDVYPSAIPLNHSYANDRCLTHESLVRILNSLPSASGKTLNLSAWNVARLSAAEKAIATSKGWAIAN